MSDDTGEGAKGCFLLIFRGRRKGQEEKEDLFSTKDLNYMSYAVGIMGIESMDPKLRAVIAAEILKKEK